MNGRRVSLRGDDSVLELKCCLQGLVTVLKPLNSTL